MFKDVKFLATTAQPSYKEVSHWIDLLEDPTGGTIKVWNGTSWKKISGEGDGDTGLVIGDTTGTAYDGGKGKELENEVDTIKKNTNDAILFKFDTLDLRNKLQSFLLSFVELLLFSASAYSKPIILQYAHNYNLVDDTITNEVVSSVVTVTQKNLDTIQNTVEYVLCSNVYYSKSNNRDQFIKITASFNIADGSNIQADFQVEEIPVDLSGTSGDNLFYVFPEDKFVNGAVLTEDEYNGLQKAVDEHKIAIFVNSIMELRRSDSDNLIYFGVTTNYINRQYISPDDYYSHVFIYATGNIDEQRTVHIDNEYNKTGSLCYVYGQDKDIAFIPSTIFKQGLTELQEALDLADIPMFIDYFEDDSDARLLKISNLTSKDSNTILSIDNISTSNDAINLNVQTRYIIESGSSLEIATTINKTIDLKLSGDGTKFLSDDGTYKEIASESGITDAPADGKTYGRKDSTWTEIITPDTSTFATKDELATKADLTGAQFTGSVDARQISLSHPTDGAMFSMLPNSRDITFRTLNAGIDSMNFQVQSTIPLKITEAGIFENGTLLSSKYASIDSLDTKQDNLVSGINIKTINNQSLLGEGNIAIAAGDSSVCYLDLSQYFTNLGASDERYTGTISEEDISEINAAVTSSKLIVGIFSRENFYDLVPFTETATSQIIVLFGTLMGYNVYLQINTSTREYVGYYIGSSYQSDSSETVTVLPLKGEDIYISPSSDNSLTNINVPSNMGTFSLTVVTGVDQVQLNIDGMNGVIGLTLSDNNIVLDPESKYEIDYRNNVAVGAKITYVPSLS